MYLALIILYLCPAFYDNFLLTCIFVMPFPKQPWSCILWQFMSSSIWWKLFIFERSCSCLLDNGKLLLLHRRQVFRIEWGRLGKHMEVNRGIASVARSHGFKCCQNCQAGFKLVLESFSCYVYLQNIWELLQKVSHVLWKRSVNVFC